jgi:hypothetical protein
MSAGDAGPPLQLSFDNCYSGRLVVISPTTGPQPSRLRWNDAKSELPVLIVFNFGSVTCLPCGATVAHPSCSRFRRYQMIVVFCEDNLHVSYLVRTPAEKPGHDVLALPVSAFAQMPRVLPNFQPLFECEFERNAAAFGAVLVLIVFLFPFEHAEPYWLRMILTRCRDGGTRGPCVLREVQLARPTPGRHSPGQCRAPRLSGGASSLGTLLLPPRVNGRPHEGWQTEKLMLRSPRAKPLKAL